MKTLKKFRISVYLLAFGVFAINAEKSFAQVHIEPAGSSNASIAVPVENQIFAEYRVISESGLDFLYIDTCDMVFYGWGNFSALSLREVTILVDSQSRLMQMELPGNDWQFYPYILMGFQGGTDTAIISFVADIPSGTGSFPEAGDSLTTSISCRFFFGANTAQTYSTNIASGQIVNIAAAIGVPEMRPNIKLKQVKPRSLGKFNILGQRIK